jgi:hypothetical protein
MVRQTGFDGAASPAGAVNRIDSVLKLFVNCSVGQRPSCPGKQRQEARRHKLHGDYDRLLARPDQIMTL